VEDDVRVEAGEAEVFPISLEWRSSGPRFVALDGSSRMFGSPNFRLFVASVAIYGVLDSRGPTRLFPSPGEGPLFAAKADEEALKALEEGLRGFVQVKDLKGRYFSRVSEEVVGDWFRGYLETLALQRLEGAGVELAILDGPIYLPVSAFGDLAEFRVKTIGQLDMPVVGVVKRVGRSKLLCRARELVEKFNVASGDCNDEFLAYEILKGARGPVAAVGPFKAAVVGHTLDKYAVEDRVFWYIYVKYAGRVYRVEALVRHRDGAEEFVKGMPLGATGLPYMVELVDKLARSTRRIFTQCLDTRPAAAACL